MVYDALIVVAILMVAAVFVVVPLGSEVRSGTLWFQAYLLVAWWAYFAVCWRMGGQTVGMRAWRVKLITNSGRRIGWGGSVLRFAAAFLSAAPLAMGFFWGLLDPRGRTWHDRASDSRLVVLPRRGRSAGDNNP